jgi:hypothetical protein
MKNQIILITIIIGLCSCSCYTQQVTWEDSIKNKDNEEYVWEVAINNGIAYDKVTQKLFNKRYKIK